jgi:hypothetical protein
MINVINVGGLVIPRSGRLKDNGMMDDAAHEMTLDR